MKRQELLAAEYGYRWQDKPRAEIRIALAFPNVYQLAMSNLGFQLVWKAAHDHVAASAERVFLPATGEPSAPASLESGRGLKDFDAVAFSLSYEQDYLNVLAMLDGAGIPHRAADRRREHPLLIAGGPALWGNPEPVAPFFDAVVIGEGEEVIGEILSCLAEYRSRSGTGRSEPDRQRLLSALAELPGLYVPVLYESRYAAGGAFAGLAPRLSAPEAIARRWIRDLDRHPAQSVVLTPHTEFADTHLVEIARGCSRSCRFCMAGFITRPVRYRQVSRLIEQVDQGLARTRKIGLLSASVSDHPDLVALGEHLRTRDVRLYLSSIRADAVTPEFIALLRHGGLKSLTVAPEAGSEPMRARINKHLTHHDLMRCVQVAGEGGMQGLKYYVMIGLPHETDADVQATIELLADTVKTGRPLGIRRFVIDLHPFVPKAFTPFQREPRAELERFEKIFARLRGPLARLGVQTRFDSPAWAVIQERLARGDRRTADVIERAYAAGGNLSAYRRALKESPIPPGFGPDAVLPWAHIQSGLEPRFLAHEAHRAERGQQSPPCPISAPLLLAPPTCRRCGVCGDGGAAGQPGRAPGYEPQGAGMDR